MGAPNPRMATGSRRWFFRIVPVDLIQAGPESPAFPWCGQTQHIDLPFSVPFATFGRMANKKISPLQASFWLSEQEKRYVLVICAIFLLGLIARHYYLKNEKTEVYTPPGLEQTEQRHE